MWHKMLPTIPVEVGALGFEKVPIDTLKVFPGSP